MPIVTYDYRTLLLWREDQLAESSADGFPDGGVFARHGQRQVAEVSAADRQTHGQVVQQRDRPIVDAAVDARAMDVRAFAVRANHGNRSQLAHELRSSSPIALGPWAMLGPPGGREDARLRLPAQAAWGAGHPVWTPGRRFLDRRDGCSAQQGARRRGAAGRGREGLEGRGAAAAFWGTRPLPQTPYPLLCSGEGGSEGGDPRGGAGRHGRAASSFANRSGRGRGAQHGRGRGAGRAAACPVCRPFAA